MYLITICSQELTKVKERFAVLQKEGIFLSYLSQACVTS